MHVRKFRQRYTLEDQDSTLTKVKHGTIRLGMATTGICKETFQFVRKSEEPCDRRSELTECADV